MIQYYYKKILNKYFFMRNYRIFLALHFVYVTICRSREPYGCVYSYANLIRVQFTFRVSGISQSDDDDDDDDNLAKSERDFNCT